MIVYSLFTTPYFLLEKTFLANPKYLWKTLQNSCYINKYPVENLWKNLLLESFCYPLDTYHEILIFFYIYIINNLTNTHFKCVSA